MRRRSLSPAQLLSVHILGLVTAGGLLLSLPIAAPVGRHLSFLDAFFTSTSAVCVTGLIVIDTPRDLSIFGQVVVLLLIQAGGLGYMTISTLIASALGKRVTLQERLTLADALNVHSMEGLLRFAGTVAALTVTLEIVGALILGWRFSADLGWGRGLWVGLFHAVSAFNNAGFSLFTNNLASYRGDVTVNLVISTLIIVGGLGFFVLAELMRLRSGRLRPGLSTHTRLVLGTTVSLLAVGTLLIYVLERDNPATLGPLGTGQAVLAAYFQSVTPRTAGFNTIAIGRMTSPALFVLVALMFIGASPGGTGGGVKTTTFGITMAAIWATVRGFREPTMFGRRLSPETVARAFAVEVIAFLALNAVVALLLVVEEHGLMETLFETASAFGTVGLSMGQGDSPLSLSAFFGAGGKLLIMGMMFIGRVGPLTLAVALAGRAAPPRLRYPEGKVMIG